MDTNASHQTSGPRNGPSVWRWTRHHFQVHLQFTLENGSISILPCRFIPVAVKHAFPPGWLGHDGRHRRGQRCFVAGL